MFAFKIATILSVTALAVALPTPGGSDTCSTGTLHCCDTSSPSSSSNNALLAGILPVGFQGLNLPIGAMCDPITATGLGTSGTCNSQTACCSNVSNSGLAPISLACSPINIGL